MNCGLHRYQGFYCYQVCVATSVVLFFNHRPWCLERYRVYLEKEHLPRIQICKQGPNVTKMKHRILVKGLISGNFLNENETKQGWSNNGRNIHYFVWNIMQLSPEGEVNSGGYIPRREASIVAFSSIYPIRWIKKCRFINDHNFFLWNFRETTRHFSLRSQNSEYPRIFQVTGANQNARKLLSTDLVNTKSGYIIYLEGFFLRKKQTLHTNSNPFTPPKKCSQHSQDSQLVSVPAFLHVETTMSRVGAWTDPLHI